MFNIMQYNDGEQLDKKQQFKFILQTGMFVYSIIDRYGYLDNRRYKDDFVLNYIKNIMIIE
jgi:nitrate reductase beta subunit